jgi:hypothetical protein
MSFTTTITLIEAIEWLSMSIETAQRGYYHASFHPPNQAYHIRKQRQLARVIEHRKSRKAKAKALP